MPVTRTDLALQMIAQLRLLDPSVSAEIGTPERKILDTVASSLYDNQIDLSALSSGLDIDSKYGAQLDRFLNIFGFARQSSVAATGFVTFSRLTPSTSDIRIPAGSTVRAPTEVGFTAETGDPGVSEVRFVTTYDVILPAGSLSVTVPVRCTIPGKVGNVAAERITDIVGTTIYGITSVTNETATTNGLDSESDAEFKTRFKNTIFRNLAGTQDQYMALSVATAFTSRANVVGPQSHYREYIQVPFVDDASSYDIAGTGPISGAGNAGEYTTALSTIPYAKYLWVTLPVFVSNGEVGLGTIFYREDSDFRFNTAVIGRRQAGDTERLYQAGAGPLSTDGIWPNITFTNVYTGADGNVQAVAPGDVLLLEYTYLSNASRNDPTLGITNAVDVYVDGGNETSASMVTIRPTTATAFVDDPTSKFHYDNYRRTGEATTRPLLGNVFMSIFWQPVIDVPDQIIVGTTTYLKGVHYWTVVDVSALGGTIRARNGIEWSTKVQGKTDTDPLGDPSAYTGPIITDATGDPAGGQPVEVENYTYDKSIVDLQAALEGAKQVTTDVLAHKTKERLFKLDLTVMYTPGASIASTNLALREAIDSYLKSLYFGSTIQLSDLLEVAHSVGGVDNVRWTTDTPNSPDLIRVYEVDDNGAPLAGISVDRYQPGNSLRPEIQIVRVTGGDAGNFTLSWGGHTTANLAYSVSAAAVQTALNGLAGIGTVSVTETLALSDTRFFVVTWSGTGAKSVITGQASFTKSDYLLNSDFFLRDDELTRLPTGVYTPSSGAADTVAGLIIRPRAQNTWTVR